MSAAPLHKVGLTCSLRDLASSAYEAGYAIHGDLELGFEEYSDRLPLTVRKCGHREEDSRAAEFLIRELHTTDLYLSAACALSRDKAWWRFDALYRKYINDLVSYICSVRTIAMEIRESFAAHLFLPDSTGRSRISSYDGRSSLPTWLRVIVTNRIINEGHRKCNSTQRDEPQPEIEDRTALPCLERHLALGRYELLLRRAVRHACETLSDKERELLLSRFDHGAQLGEIAQRFSVHQSTITRTLERIGRRLRGEVISILTAWDLDEAAIHECLSILTDGSCQSISIFEYIREAKPAPERKGREVGCP